MASESISSQLGVLSYKVVCFTRRDHPNLGLRLFIYQPRKVTKQLHVLRDSDFLEGSEVIFSSKHRLYKAVSPGVSCDLFLTSLYLFKHVPNAVTSFKAMMMEKWKLLSGANQMKSIMLLFYRAATMGRSYRKKLLAEITRFDLTTSANTRKIKTCSKRVREEYFLIPTTIQPASADFRGYSRLYFAPLQWQSPETSHGNKPVQSTEYSYPIVHNIRGDDTSFASTPFSFNLTGFYAEILTSSTPNWQRVYVKTVQSVQAELGAFPMVQQCFSSGSVQTIAAAKPAIGRIFFERFDRDVLNQIRLDYYYRLASFKTNLIDWNYLSDEWFIDLDLRQAQDVLAVYTGFFQPNDPSILCSQQRIHAFFHYCPWENCRFQAFYSGNYPSFLQHTTCEIMNLEAFLDSPLVINGQNHQFLQYHLNRACLVLDPNKVEGLSSLLIAFGFGDGHGGNVMVSNASSPASILYVDYEVAGHHTPFLDLAKLIYQDGFFNIAYADILYDDLTRRSHCKQDSVRWKEDAGSIHINYHLDLKTLEKGLAVIKLKYLLKPMLDALDHTASHQRELAEEILAYGLFACALLTRNYSTRANIFYPNLAIGVCLAAEIKRVFSDCFGWCNWRLHVPIIEMPTSGYLTSTSCNGHQDLRYLNQRHPRLQFFTALECMRRGNDNQTFNTKLLDGLGDLEWTILVDDRPKKMAAQIQNLLYGISRAPEVEVYCLNREAEMLALHRKFSSTLNKSVWMVTQRISDAWKKAMRLSDCITYPLY